ncbi:MAG: hypothetical protein IJD01_07275, partial [Clostridia bacterium]|nr:hypothetical protein [Clostridia bacterium]
MVLLRRIARLGKSEETLKLEALFRKAAKTSTQVHNTKADAQTDAAADTATETQKHPTEDGEVQYSLPYMDAIDQLSEETLDRSQNTHLMVLEHTP